MDKLLNLFVSIVSQPSILVSLIALLGLVLQKKKFSEVIQGTIKTFVGFLVLIGGAGLISNSLTPFASMFQTALHTQGVVPSNEAVVAIALQQFGTPTALIMLVGMIVNILLARFTRYKFIFLTGQAMLYVSCLTAVILVSAGFTANVWMILLGGHTGNIGYASSGWIGKFFGNKDRSTEDIKIPKSFSFLRDSTVSIMLLMSIVYVALALLAGPGFVERELSNGDNAVIFALIQAGTFTAGFVIVLQGVRMVLAEIVPAFQGIAKKLVPDSKPALDVPIVFPYAPNAVLIGFFVSFFVGTLSMFAMIGLQTTVIIPGVVGHFFCGAASGVFGNSTGGRRGAVLGSAFNSLLISWLPLFILPVLGDLKIASSTFADTDYLVPGLVLGKLGEYGQMALTVGIIAFFLLVVLSSFLFAGKRTNIVSKEQN